MAGQEAKDSSGSGQPEHQDTSRKEVKKDDINSPSHYAAGREIEPIDAIEDWDLGFNLGNVVKYVSRAGRKEDRLLTDLKKAAWYLQREIEKHEKQADLYEYVLDYYGETLDRYS
jgi:hypothetical protein